MKKIPTLLLSIVCLPVLGFGGQIFGNLKKNGESVGEYGFVRIECTEEERKEAKEKEEIRKQRSIKTNAYGAYSLPVPNSQKCQLLVYYDGRWSKNKVDVYSNEDPVRYDFDLVIQDGSLTIKRR